MERNQTAYVILGILAIHDNQSGYEIRKTIQQSVGFFWGESYGQIYPTLKRLAGEGLIVPVNPEAKSGKPRQEYSITPAGRERLQHWLTLPYRHDPPRDEFLLKLFFGFETTPSIAVAHIQRFQGESQAMLATLQNLEAASRAHSGHHPGFPFWMLTLNYGLAQLRANLEWSESALAMLTGGRAAPMPPPSSTDDNT